MPKPTLKAAIDAGARRLERVSASARLDAELLLAHILRKDRSWLHAHPGSPIDDRTAADYERDLTRRATGEPVAYITGQREFWSLSLDITPGVLIPRPDTETLVLAALDLFQDRPPTRMADLGTGSGAVALALACEWSHCEIVATEASPEALEVARRNAVKHGIRSVSFRSASQGDWCGALAHNTFDLIVSNPPYVAAGDPHLQAPEILHEPAVALVGGTDGLDALRAIANCVPQYLEDGGWLLVEHGMDQADAVGALFEEAGLADRRTWRDLAGHQRVTGGCRHMLRR